MPKKKNNSEKITALHVSIFLNIILAILILSGLIGLLIVRNDFKNGKSYVVRWAFEAQDNFCNSANRIDQISKEIENSDSSDEEKKSQLVFLEHVTCQSAEYSEFMSETQKEFFRSKGVNNY